MCTERLLQVVTLLDKNNLLGKVKITAVGTGTANCARGLLSDLKIDAVASQLTLYVDPDRHAYQYFGLHRGVRRTFTWKNPENYQGMNEFPKHCCLRGRLPMINAGDPWQQGATLIYMKKSIYENIETSPGWPRINDDEFIKAAKKLTTTG
jgi:YD repeat-containing protein